MTNQVLGDFERNLALSILTATRWAVDQGTDNPYKKRVFWDEVMPRWLWLFNGGESPGIGVPSRQVSMALMAGIVPFLAPSGPDDFREEAVNLAKEAERRVASETDEQLERYLGELGHWKFNRYHRRWLAQRIGRVLEAMLTREATDGERLYELSTDGARFVERILSALGFEPADRTPSAAPPDLPDSLAWWQPEPIDLSPNSLTSTSPFNSSPPIAMKANLQSVLQQDHFEIAVAWYLGVVLPYIDDLGAGGGGAERMGIGRSRFSSAWPYHDQAARTRLLLWTLADALMVAAEARRSSGDSDDELVRARLPLVRAIWSEEVTGAIDHLLPYEPDKPHDFDDPEFAANLMRRADLRNEIEVRALKFLRTDESGLDDMTALQLVMGVRAALAPQRTGFFAKLFRT